MSDLAQIIDDDTLIEFVKLDEFLAVINSEPPSSFIKTHPLAKNVKYIPIDKIELMLAKVFQQTKVEILREGQLLNSVYATVRLHYKHPVLKEWAFQDGVGAAPIQTDKGKSASDIAAIKNDAIMIALPAAESFAVKDAAEKIGKVFGRDLNRKDTLGFTPSYDTASTKKRLRDSIAKLNEESKESS